MTEHINAPVLLLRVVAIASAIVLAGCAPLSPQIFSDDMLPQQPPKSGVQEPAAGTFAEAKAGALQAMRSYNAAVQELSGVSPKVSAALIGLSALALLKSISHPNGSDIAGIGIVGSAAYLYGSTVVSKPRQLTYLAGSRALACSIAASEPYNVSTTDLQRWTTAGTAVGEKQAALQRLLDSNADLLKQETETVAPPKTRSGCATSDRPVCPPPPVPDTATPAERAIVNQSCSTLLRNWDLQCKPAAAPPTKVHTANPELRLAVAQAQAELAAATALAAEVAALRGKLGNAANDLRWQSQQIQLRVSEEVLKTEPDIASILAATGGLRATAFSLTGAAAFAPPAGRAESAPSPAQVALARPADARTLKAITDIRAATTDLTAARLAWSGLVTPTLEAVRASKNTLQQCQFVAPGIALKVHPDVDEIQMSPNATQAFYVSGGTGAISWRVVSLGGQAAGVIKPAVDAAGHVSYIYTAPALAAGASSSDSILFTDATEQARRAIGVRIASTGTVVGDGEPVLMSDQDKLTLGIPANATKAQMATTVAACQKLLSMPSPQTGVYDSATQAGVQAGTCRNLFKI